MLLYTIWTAAGFLCALLGIYLYLVLRYLIQRWQDQKKEQRKRVFSPVLAAYIRTGLLEPAKLPVRRIDCKAAEELLLQYLHTLHKPLAQQRLKEFAEKSLTSYYRRKLRHPRRGVRYNTLLLIDKLRVSTLHADIVRLLKQVRTTDAERLEAYRILASQHYRGLSDIIRHAQQWPDVLYRDILHRLDEQEFASYVKQFFNWPKRLQYNLIDVIGDKQELAAIPLLERLLQEEDAEIRVRTLKAISRIGLFPSKGLLVPFTKSELWQERTMAAKIMGAVQNAGFLPHLARLLADPSWWVRLTAAQAIARYEQGNSVLQQVASNSKDAFARDIAREWLLKVVQYERSAMD